MANALFLYAYAAGVKCREMVEEICVDVDLSLGVIPASTLGHGSRHDATNS
jgi:hypothetical protein